MGLPFLPQAGHLHTFATEMQVKPKQPIQSPGTLQGWGLGTHKGTPGFFQTFLSSALQTTTSLPLAPNLISYGTPHKGFHQESPGLSKETG